MYFAKLSNSIDNADKFDISLEFVKFAKLFNANVLF